MSRTGAYLGGHTVIRGVGATTPRGPKRHGRSCSVGPEFEKRKAQKREQDKKVRKQIKRNEKLALKLPKLWREEQGKAHFERLTAERQGNRPAHVPPGRALAVALQEAFAKRDQDKPAS